MKMSKNVDRMLKDGESVVATLQGNSYTTDSNPVTRMVASVVRIVNVILGAPTRTTIICTNKRLIIENAQKILWVLL
jgi:predicted methyltransferase MtxX (methanogen marker protein 4)